MRERWGSDIVVAHGKAYRPCELPGLAAAAGQNIGLLTHFVDGTSCEIVTLDSICPWPGVGASLIRAALNEAYRASCSRLWLITTNDDLPVLRLYQKRGFALVTVHRDVVAAPRWIKIEIILVGHAGIPFRDEIELEILMTREDACARKAVACVTRGRRLFVI